PPRELAGIDVPGADPAARAKLPAGAFALQNKLLAAAGLDRQRRRREALRLRWRAGRRIGRCSGIDLPDDLARILVERNHAHVVGGDEDFVAVQRQTAVGARFRDLGVVTPQRDRLGAAADIELHHPGPGVGNVQKTVLDQRGRFFLAAQRPAGRAAADREQELELEVLDVCPVDAAERRMPRVVIVAVDHEPVLRLLGGIQQSLRRHVRRCRRVNHGRKADRSKHTDCSGHDVLPLPQCHIVRRAARFIGARPWARRFLGGLLSAPRHRHHPVSGGSIPIAIPSSGRYMRAISHADLGLTAVRWLDRPFRGRSKLTGPRRLNRRMTMALPEYSMRQLLEAGVHFGHQAHRWNPKMGEYIFGTRNNIHIIDLAQSVPMLHRALQAVSDTVAKGGRILFVGTKRQAQDAVADAAKRCAQYYVNSRWLGGTLTNWKTISGSISRLRKLDEMLTSNEAGGYTKKERLDLQRERDKLDRALGGIKDMGGLPDLLFVIDTNKEDIAIK